MTIEQAENLISRLEHWMKVDVRHDSALRAYCAAIAPGSYPPIVDDSFASAFIEGASHGRTGMKEDLSYFAWEVPSMRGPATVTEKDGTVHDFKKRRQVIKYFVKNY